MGSENSNLNKENPWPSQKKTHRHQDDKGKDMSLWGILLFGLIGATTTTFAIGHMRRTADWFYAQLRSQSARKGGNSGSSYRTSFQEEAWKRYNRRMQEEYEQEMERVERIRRMQSVFNRERNKYRRGYESWRETGHGAYHQHSQREDWYWKTDSSFREQRSNFRKPPRDNASYPLSHHYTVLGLDRSRKQPYTEAEIKTAFRAKAMEFHPDQNLDNKEVAETKFKEVMTSYEAIKQEHKDMKF